MSININDIILKNFFKDSKLLNSYIFKLIGDYLFYIVTPNSLTKLLSKDLKKEKCIYKHIFPFFLSYIIYGVSDYLYSESITNFENNVINEILEKVTLSLKNNKKEINNIELLNNLLKVFVFKNILHLIFNYYMPCFIIIFGIFYYYYKVDKNLAYTSLIINIISLIVLLLYGFLCLKSSNNKNIIHDNYITDINDIISNIDKIIISDTYKDEINRLRKIQKDNSKYYLDNERKNTNLKTLFSVISIIILFTIGYKLLILLNKGKIKKEQFISYIYILINLVSYYDNASVEIYQLNRYIGEYKHMKNYFSQFNTQTYEIIKLNITQGIINIKNLTFSFNNKKILDNYNLTIYPNKLNCIVGRIGKGKSTLLKCILQLYNYEGEILVDNQNIKNSDISNYITYFPQFTVFFNRSIQDNLFYNCKDKNNCIIKLSEFFQNSILGDDITNFFKEFEKGLDTIITKNNLSGGQRQLLFLIKTILDDQRIILMDEPTNSLDPYYKGLFIKILKNMLLKEDKTILIVSHDENLIKECENIITLN